MAIRKLPFGYETRMGKVRVQEREAGVVVGIFDAYAEGVSYLKLTDHLNGQPVPYHEPGKPWNKNMVARILQCRAYLGEDGYPPIITQRKWELAHAARPEKVTPTMPPEQKKAIRLLARCPSCGERLEFSTNRTGWNRYQCRACDMLTTATSPELVMESVHALMTRLILDPSLVHAEASAPDACRDMEEEFNAMTSTPGFDEDAALAMALSLTAARFRAVGSEEYETVRIRRVLAAAEAACGPDTELLRQIAAAILIHPDGTVSLKLKNGQITERSTTP